MTVIMTLLARDEIDVVDSWLAFHLNAGVDLVIATDNLSRDGTTDVLEEYARSGHVHLIREDGDVYHTYSDYARVGEEAIGTLMILDRAPKGRNESGSLSFVKRKDEYEDAPKTHSCCD